MIKTLKIFSSVTIKRILPCISYILIILSLFLQFGAQNSMGISRDLIYRNAILENTILTFKLLQIYMIIALIGLFICIIILHFNSRKEHFFLKISNNRYTFRKYLWFIIILSLFFIVMINFYDKISWIVYPFMILTIGIGLIVQYIRIIFLSFQ